MSIIKNLDTYAYEGDRELVINTNHAVDLRSSRTGTHPTYPSPYRYLITLPEEEYRQMVRYILGNSAPPWVTKGMITAAVERFMHRYDKYEALR